MSLLTQALPALLIGKCFAFNVHMGAVKWIKPLIFTVLLYSKGSAMY